MGSRIVTTHEALSESYIPQNILHREKELSQLSSAINVVNTFIYGPTGSGKTLLIKKAIQDFNAKSSGMAIYIDCCLYQTINAIFHQDPYPCLPERLKLTFAFSTESLQLKDKKHLRLRRASVFPLS